MYDLYARQMGKIQERAQTKRPDPKYVKGGEVLRIIRIRLNVTQRQFGLLLDVSHATLSCWESGHSRPPRLSVLGLKSILPSQVASLVTLESFGYRTNPNNV
jgi:DNA-binding transcriptional regulator YiaG